MTGRFRRPCQTGRLLAYSMGMVPGATLTGRAGIRYIRHAIASWRHVAVHVLVTYTGTTTRGHGRRTRQHPTSRASSALWGASVGRFRGVRCALSIHGTLPGRYDSY